MKTRPQRVAAALIAALVLGCLAVSSTTSAQAGGSLKALDFRVALLPVSSIDHALPGDVSYGQSQLAGVTSWGKRPATVEWLCSHRATSGAGPTNDLVTITRSDGAVLALAVSGWVSDGRLRGTVEVIGGKGAYRGASGTGTVTGSSGTARIQLTVAQPGATDARSAGGGAVSRRGVGC